MSYISKEDAQASIHSLRGENKQVQPKVEHDIVNYTIKGKETSLDNTGNPVLSYNTEKKDDLVFARKYCTMPARYYVRMSRLNRMYNPFDMYNSGNSNKEQMKLGRPTWKLKEVSKLVFDLYVAFLRTKNEANLLNAERQYE